MVIAKYADHLPLYRQAQIYAARASNSTARRWPTGRGAPDRKHERPAAHLAGFAGCLQVDGYGAYKALAEGNAVTLAFCWAHARRNFFDIQAANPAPIAVEVLARIGSLYAIERDIRGLGASARLAARQARARSILEAMKPWLEAKLAAVSGKSKLAEAIRYALSRWAGLTRRYLDDGRIEIDNNVVERAMRPIALGRNYAHPVIMRSRPRQRPANHLHSLAVPSWRSCA